jgi:ABC-2 type transport system permease protein
VVAQFLGLKLRLLANSFRRGPWQVIGLLIALAYGIAAVSLAVAGLAALRGASVAVATGITVSAGSVVVLCFLLLPLAFGADDTLDPRAFALFGLPATKLAATLALTSVIGVPALFITVVSIAQVVTWSRSPLATFLAVVGAMAIVATCLLGSRVTAAIASSVLATRRAREVSVLVVLILIVSISPIITIALSRGWAAGAPQILERIARVVGWTPLGAAWAAPADAAAGHPGSAVLKALIALGFLAVLALAWRALIGWMLVSAPRISRERGYSGLGWFGRTPSTPFGAVAARSITYWIRDARYRTALIAIPAAPLVFAIILAVAGVPLNLLALIPIPVMCLFLSWSVHNDVSYDNSAIWLHVASNTAGWADRLGRTIPALIIGIPLVFVGSPLFSALYGDHGILPSMIGVSFCILFAGLGLSSVISARFPYASVRPGDSPFAQPQAAGTSAGLIQSMAFVLTLVFSAPPVYFATRGMLDGGSWAGLSLLVGIGFGLLVFAGGVAWGGAIFSKRAPELLAFTLRN